MAKVLIIDDDRLCQKLVGKIFVNAGHETLIARSASEAWDRLYEHGIVDMIVLDNQLEQEWGWQFLRTLRQHSTYTGLPVIVYTGHTERDSIVRYFELGVQSVNMKPYLSEVLLTEFTKAIASNWTSHIIEPTEVICERLNHTPAQYSSLLATADSTITEKLHLARTRMAVSSTTQIFAALTSIEQQCRSVGLIAIEAVTAKIRHNISDGNLIEAYEGLRIVDSFVGIIRQRMLQMLQMNGAVAQGGLTIDKRLTTPEEEAPATCFSGAYAREIIDKPLWRFGPQLRQAIPHPLTTVPELAELSKRMTEVAPFTTLVESLDLLSSIPSQSVESALQYSWDTPEFTKHYAFILQRVTGTQVSLETKISLQRAMEQQGLIKVVLIAMLLRMANKLPPETTLNLRPLCVQTFTTTLISFELGRLLKLKNSFMLPAAGLAHDSGRWLFSYGKPALFGLALALAADGKLTLEQAEAVLFGQNHHQVGQMLLADLGQSELLQDTALNYQDPAAVTNPDNIIIVTVTHLSNLLAIASGSGNAKNAAALIERLRQPHYPAWALLQSRGVALPFEVPELVETLQKIALTSHWIAHQLLSHSL